MNMDSFDFNQFANSLQKAQSYAVSYKHRNDDGYILSCFPQSHGDQVSHCIRNEINKPNIQIVYQF